MRAVVALAMGMGCGLANAQSCTPFTDVPANDPFCGNIQWMYNRGVTLGCTSTTYCPADATRRDQMAAFMNRLANALFPETCATGSVMKWNGSSWACAPDAGTVTSVTAGTGLTGGTITTTGTIAVDTTFVQRRVALSCAAGSSIRAIAADGSVTCEADDSGPVNAFVQGGNAFGATAVLGTTDTRPLELITQGIRGFRLSYVPADTIVAGINVTGGDPANLIARDCGILPCALGEPVRGATIAGGGSPGNGNRITDSFSSIGGGLENIAGNVNSAHNDAGYATIAGGGFNQASGEASTIGGGTENIASNIYTTVAGGHENEASGSGATVGGGRLHVASGFATTIPGGQQNLAAGSLSFAAGYRAQANADGCFVWSDEHSNDSTPCNTANQFLARAAGGFALRTNAALTSGCVIAPGGGSWSCSSSRELKDDFVPVDAGAVLDGVVAMPIATWRYRDEAGRARHLGPTAEDFRAAFGLGDSPRDIGMIDGQGVALAAIQGLNAKLEARLAERDRTIAAQQRALDAQAAELSALKAVVERLAENRR